jgi:trk system potassium uptake protein TrkA
MARQVVIVGGGAVGTHLAALLLAGGHHVRVIEVQPEELTRLQRELTRDVVTIGNGTDPAVLEATGVRQAQVVAAVTGTDATNLVVTSLARFAFVAERVRVNCRHPPWDTPDSTPYPRPATGR